MAINSRARRTVLHFLCALLLVFAGLAHRPVSVEAATLDYVIELPDGSTPNLCVTQTSDQKSPDHAGAYGCDACRIASATVLPAPPIVSVVAPVATLVEPVRASQTDTIRFLFRRGSPPRAPPGLIV